MSNEEEENDSNDYDGPSNPLAVIDAYLGNFITIGLEKLTPRSAISQGLIAMVPAGVVTLISYLLGWLSLCITFIHQTGNSELLAQEGFDACSAVIPPIAYPITLFVSLTLGGITLAVSYYLIQYTSSFISSE